MRFNKSFIAIAIIAALSTACSNNVATQHSNLESESSSTKAKMLEKESKIEKASLAANTLFDTIFMEGVNRNPVTQTALGIKTNYDKWQDLSEENSAKELAFTKDALKRIQVIDINNVDKQTALSYKLLSQKLQQSIDDYKWRHYNYPVNQMFGVHSQIPSLLINQHSIADEKQARDYIARVKNAKLLLEQLVEQLKIREHKGIVPPKFVFAHVIRDSKNLLIGAPFDHQENSTIYALSLIHI